MSARARERAATPRMPSPPQHFHFKIFLYESIGGDGSFQNSVECDLVDVDKENAIRRAIALAEGASNEPDLFRRRHWMKYARQCEDPTHLEGIPTT